VKHTQMLSEMISSAKTASCCSPIDAGLVMVDIQV
jgi:hypothetical protein